MIHFFTKGGLSSATARYRGFLVAKELEFRGYAATVHQPPIWRSFFEISFARIKELGRHIKILFFLKKEDIVYLIRTVYQSDFLFLIILFKIFFRIKFIFDFDDPIFLRKSLKLRMIILTKLADAVVVGSHYLTEWAGRYNKKVFIVPTSVPFSLYAKNTKDYEPSAKENLTIGWIGNGPAHYENLQILVSVFRKLLQDKVLFKFILIGSLKNDKIHRLFKKIEGLDSNIIDELDWGNPENISREIKRFDLGLMPLVDNKWNRGKCAFKAIEYMACGVPPIISPVGENKHLVSHGVNGFLASDTEDWIEAIKKIDQDRSLIFVMGRKAQETIRAGYSFETSIPKIIKIIEGIK